MMRKPTGTPVARSFGGPDAVLFAGLSLTLSLSLFLSCAATRAPAAPTTNPTNAAAPLFVGAGPPVALASDLPFVSLEGPFWNAASQRLFFSDVVEANAPGAVIYQFDPRTRQFSIVPYPAAPPAGGPASTNGLAFDGGGNLLACERYNARLVRLGTDGILTVLADGWPAHSLSQNPAREAALNRKPFNAPNDLAVRHDGNIYFTDSDWGAKPGGVKPGGANASMGVYRLSPRGQLSRVMDLEKPNGIALSPDEATLYVGSDVQAKVWRLALDSEGTPGAPALFIDGAQVPGGFKVPDGICVDDSGNLYVTNNADDVKAIVAFDSSGHSLGRIPLPHAPSNCTFGGPDRRTMYVTTLHAVYEVRMPTAGRP